jgi:hypothetical protein
LLSTRRGRISIYSENGGDLIIDLVGSYTGALELRRRRPLACSYR